MKLLLWLFICGLLMSCGKQDRPEILGRWKSVERLGCDTKTDKSSVLSNKLSGNEIEFFRDKARMTVVQNECAVTTEMDVEYREKELVMRNTRLFSTSCENTKKVKKAEQLFTFKVEGQILQLESKYGKQACGYLVRG